MVLPGGRGHTGVANGCLYPVDPVDNRRPLWTYHKVMTDPRLTDPRLAALVYRLRSAPPARRGALVLFHGRGADEHDLYPILDILDPKNHLLGLTPRGPLALPPGGAHWYVSGTIGAPDPATFLRSYARTSAWLDALSADTGIPPERMILGGFSQGAVMAYALGLGATRPRPGAVVALSGFIPTVEGFEIDLRRPLPPIAIGHGTYDEVIPPAFSRRARDLLAGSGAAVRYRESPLPHTIDPSFLVELVPWIDRAVEATDPGGGGGAVDPRAEAPQRSSEM
jgi:phospholipase/carboxylesterase